MEHKQTLNRREFISNGGLGIAGLLIGFNFPGTAAPSGSPASSSDNRQLNAYLRIGVDDTIHIILPKVEMGQGIWTTLPMLIAEELDCDWNRIKVESGKPGTESDFRQSVALQSTGGSETTVSEFDKCRMAGATARLMLIHAAAKRLGTLPQNCRTEAGFVLFGAERISYGSLAQDAAALPVPAQVVLKDPKDWIHIGKSKRRLDAPEKINGKAVYGIDIQFPGLLIAVVAHPPVFGATVKSFDASAAMKLKGVHQVLEIPTGIAVIADNFWIAKKGKDALKIAWDPGVVPNVGSEDLLEKYSEIAKTEGMLVAEKGNVMQGFEHTTSQIEAEFSFPYLAHAPMEPLNCTVKITTNSCEVWTGTQSPFLHQEEIGAFLGLKPESVLLHTPYVGGSFGRRGSFSGDWIMEAVQIAKASGEFIKLVWTREDDIQGGYYRPAYVHNVKIGVDNDGFPVAWQHRIVGQSLFTNTPLEFLIAPNGIDYSSVTRAAPYSEAFKHYSFELHTTKVNIPVLAWRSVGATHTTFVVETLIDELATRAAVDPVAYRRILLKNSPRHLAALNLAVEKAGWGSPLPKGHFQGVAVCEAMGSYVCQIVELSVRNEEIKLHKVTCAIDCGLAVNPDGVRAQMEGGIVYGLTAALFGEITLKSGQVQQSNFHDYRIMRMNETPDIAVHIADSKERMGGAGEPGVAPIAAALANALFAAVGKRFRKLPIRLDGV